MPFEPHQSTGQGTVVGWPSRPYTPFFTVHHIPSPLGGLWLTHSEPGRVLHGQQKPASDPGAEPAPREEIMHYDQ